MRLLRAWLSPDAPSIKEHQDRAMEVIERTTETIRREDSLAEIRLRQLREQAQATRWRTD